MQGPREIMAIVGKKAGTVAMGVSNGLYACLAEARIQFPFVHAVSGSKPDERRAHQTAKQAESYKHEQPPSNPLDSISHPVSRLNIAPANETAEAHQPT